MPRSGYAAACAARPRNSKPNLRLPRKSRCARRMPAAWAISATSTSAKAPASTSRRLPTPISSAGQPTTWMRTASSGSTVASADAASSVAGPERLWPQAWPISGSASISASSATRSGACVAAAGRDEGGLHGGDGRLDAKALRDEPGAVARACLVLDERQFRVGGHPARELAGFGEARVDGGEQLLAFAFGGAARSRHPVPDRPDGAAA